MRYSSSEVGNDIYFEIVDYANNKNEYWDETLTTLIVLYGTTEIVSEGAKYSLQKDDVLVINRYTPYSMYVSGDAILLSAHIDPSFLRSHQDILESKRVRCCSATPSGDKDEPARYDLIRRYIAKIFNAIIDREQDGLRLFVYEEMVSLLRIYEKYFSVRISKDESHHGDRMRFKRILEYIRNNYAQPITLESLASTEFLSPGYFSRFFSKHIGVSFTQYLKMLRLGYAYVAICNTNDSITTIAMNNGFPNINAFISAFKEEYGDTPKAFRKNVNLTRGEHKQHDGDKLLGAVVDTLSAYMVEGDHGSVQTTPARTITPDEVIIDINGQSISWPHNWKKLLTMGWAKEVLLAPVQEQIKKCQEDIGFEYIRFHGILDDDMNIYREDEEGKPIYNFGYLDILFDFILSVHLKPFVEFSFVPSAMVSEKTYRYEHSSVFNAPSDMSKWEGLIYNLMKHWIERYGVNEVKSWWFSNISGYYIFVGVFTVDEYIAMYESVYKAVKFLIPDATIVGPGCDIGTLPLKFYDNWDKFFNYCVENDCVPDIISTQSFGGEFKEPGDVVWSLAETHTSTPASISPNPNYLLDMTSKLRTFLRKKNISKPRILIDAWNSTMWQRDVANDTAYKAAYIVKNVMQAGDRLEAMGYWAMTDFMEELPVEQKIFHGGYGLFTYNGLPKCGYYAYTFLNKLGDQLIVQGDDYAVFKREGVFTVICYNYTHYDRMFLDVERNGDSLNARYQVFEPKSDINKLFVLKGLECEDYMVETYTISRENGNVYDQWVKMGSPNVLQPSAQDYLKGISRPSYTVTTLDAKQGEIELSVRLRAHQVTLFVVKPSGV
ncbi:MAG: helix-turn-helix domain-containing protein [Clostridiales Family XIII bacterium]|jgi:xylan 1,4-beta-xylosidase|nr:helix-turn-helix domain-containing protein [Clostridiales Family XIII bacterium]